MIKADKKILMNLDLYPSPQESHSFISRCRPEQGRQQEGLKSQLELRSLRKRGLIWKMTQKMTKNRRMGFSW